LFSLRTHEGSSRHDQALQGLTARFLLLSGLVDFSLQEAARAKMAEELTEVLL
jgi:hypothetical protein